MTQSEDRSSTSRMDWDLTSYFPSFDGPEMRSFKHDLKQDLAVILRQATELAPLRVDNVENWVRVFERAEGLKIRLSHLGSYLSCLTAADVANESFKREEAGFAVIAAEAEKLEVEFKRCLRDAKTEIFESFLNHSELTGCGYYLSRIREDALRAMVPGEERVAADLGVDGIHAWGRLYDTVAGKLEFDMTYPDGRKVRLPIARRRSLMAHPDRAVRRAAFEGGNRAWAEVEDVTAAALNAISGTRLTLNRHRGVDHFLDVAVFQAASTRATLDAMFEAIFDATELPHRILKLKANVMGTNGIAWYDLEAPLSSFSQESEITWSEGKKIVLDAFSNAYPGFAKFLRHAYGMKWIDWAPRADKRPGAFCTGSLLTRESRIFMSYNNTANDVHTLAHEAGHAFHNYLMRDIRGCAHDYPMTLAESASTFAEMILTEGLLNEPSMDDIHKARILDMETGRAAVYLMDIPVRYEFEKRLHKERINGEVGAGHLKELMTSTQREIFGDLLIPGGEDPLFWASKQHFYITGLTFYNFPYTFGFLLSCGLFARFQEQGEDFLPAYECFLRMTGSASTEKVARSTVGCDLESPMFWRSAIETLRESVEQLEKLLTRMAAPNGDPTVG
tara:strand:- start:2091 stop:3947 length:1857 start_codon:yes stop_codon:yes gene_type:complete